MPATTTLRKPRAALRTPSGDDSLRVRERYLRRRSQRRSLGDRGVIAVWVALAALVSWLFVFGFTILGR
jgi:hypothetical protein